MSRLQLSSKARGQRANRRSGARSVKGACPALPSKNHPLMEKLLLALCSVADTCKAIKRNRREIAPYYLLKDVAGQSYNVMIWLMCLESDLHQFPEMRCS
jgi:hypothetical protein